MTETQTRRFLAAVVGVLAAGAIACSKAEAPVDSKPNDIPTIAFEKYTLPNGLDVILSEDHRLPMVAVNLWYHVGPANEAAGRTGFAHLFEHMMFQGSKHVPGDSHFRLLEGAGGSSVNGTTDFDRTNYFETLPSNQLELGLWLESDRMGYLLDMVDQANLSNQQDVVRNERRQSVENRPYGIVNEAVFHTLFPQTHPYYGNVIGSHVDIQAAQLEDVKNFFKLYYAPNNASLAIVGDIDKTATKALVEKYFGAFKKGNPVPKPSVEAPKITTERRVVVQDRVELPRVIMAWTTPAYYAPGDADADIAGSVLGSGRSSRLYKSLVYEKQIAQSVSASQNSLSLGSVFEIEATARPGHTAEELEKAIDEELEKLRQSGPDAVEVNSARNVIETRVVEGLERLGGFGGVADRLNSYNHYVNDPGYLGKDLQRYREVTPGTVKAFVNAHLGRNQRVVVHGVPGTPELVFQPPTPPKSTAKPGTGSESVNPDEAWRSEQPQAAAVRPLTVPVPASFQLPNGLTVLVNERSNLPLVSANLVVRSGGAADPADKPGLANFTVTTMDEGTESKSAPQIADEVAQLGGSLNMTAGTDSSAAAVTSLKRNFPQMLTLLADVVRRPRFPQEEIDRQRSSRMASLVQQRENANALASMVMSAALFGPTHPYGHSDLGTPASNKAVTREDLIAYWSTHFVPNNAALIITGQTTVDELRPLVEKAFGDWARKDVAPMPAVSPETAKTRLVIVDKPGAPQTQLRVASIGAPRATPDYEAIVVMNETLGGLFSSRINLNLREANGYTYGAGSQFAFRRMAGPFLVATGVRTDVTAPAVTEIVKELRRMRETDVTPAELTLAKDSIVRSLPADFETSRSVNATTSNIFVYDLGLDYYTKLGARFEAVTAAQVRKAAEQYIRPDSVLVIAVGDRSKIGAALQKMNLGPVGLWTTDGVPATQTQ